MVVRHNSEVAPRDCNGQCYVLVAAMRKDERIRQHCSEAVRCTRPVQIDCIK